ncbi:Fic family protein [Candidatus Peregrinibacteria bacterium]|nr:MAG: Fic family protein [Candidatus Peregrinibacteria bacterium]
MKNMEDLLFHHRFQNISASIWEKIVRIENLKGQWISGAKLSPQILGRLKKSVLVTSTGASTRIEGSKLSDEEVEKLMKGLSVQKFSDRDTQEVQGYYELLHDVFDSWKHIHLTENNIKNLHQQMLKYAEKDQLHRGEYKKKENKVHMVNDVGESIGILFDTTEAFLTPKQMQELVEWTNEALSKNTFHPLLILGHFIVEFLHIHPFEDGNGRISRILTNLLLLQNDFAYMPYVSHEKIIEINKAEYYLALRKTQNTLRKNAEEQDITPWLEFFLSMVLEQSKQAIELLSSANLEKLLTAKQLTVWEYIQSVEFASPREISEKTGIAYATVRQSLEKLLKLKKIERLGQGRGTVYKVNSIIK